ncbi:MAG: hypothetical protein FWE48_01570 [Coriobacteriia bacterium]|nr:hypothetical protein [Coriobacteriia bacterium]MCL2870214.1 hypothetical protein [Coriobacteriia bacterium]
MTATLAVAVISLPNTALAEPTLGRAESIITEIDLGNSNFRLMTDRSAIPTDGSYSYVVEITPGDDLISVNLHFQLMREENGWPFHYFGDPIYIEREEPDADEDQDTQASNDGSNAAQDTSEVSAEPEIIRHVLQRRTADNLDGLGMEEGVYYVAVIVTATTAAGAESATLQDILVVYDPEQPQLNLMPTIHLSTLPSRDAAGIFLHHPAGGLFDEQREALDAITTWVTANSDAQLTLAVSPLFLEELHTVAQGFDYFDTQSEEVIALDANSEVAQASARTLEELRTAHTTGRLAITTQGYADPDLTVLDALDLMDDLPSHFELGRSLLTDILAQEPATITVPWTNQLTNNQLQALKEVVPQAEGQELRLILNSSAIESRPALTHEHDDQQFLQNLYWGSGQNEDTSLIIVADSELSTAMSQTGSRARFILDLLEDRQRDGLTPLLIQTHDDVDSIAMLLDNLELVSAYPWVNLINGTSQIDAPIDPLVLAAEQEVQAISETIQELKTARKAVTGLRGAQGEEIDSERQAELDFDYRSSLAIFSGPGTNIRRVSNDLSILPAAPECVALANQLQYLVDEQFSGLEIHADSVVFSGSRGSLPISVQNTSGQTFYLDIHYVASGQNILVYPEYIHQEFLLGESFLEPTIELRNIVSGSVDIELWAGDYLITTESVRVSATYADRIAIIVVVALAGTGLAFFIWKRVQSGEQNGKQRSPHKHDKTV